MPISNATRPAPMPPSSRAVRKNTMPRSAPVDAQRSIDRALLRDVAARLGIAVERMQRFLETDANAAYPSPCRAVATMLCEQADTLTAALAEDGETADAATVEQLLRTAYRLTASIDTLAAWSAPAAQESHALNSFKIAPRRGSIAYARFGSAAVTAQEAAYSTKLGFDPHATRLLLTASGMSAYAIVEAFLLRQVLDPNDVVLLHPGVYFETAAQIRSLRQLRTVNAPGVSAAAMLDAIAEHQPAVVFVDPLTNTADLRLTDLPRLLDDADKICRRETWFVVDGTMLSGACNPFAGNRRYVRVLYYESGCKYLQLGMDLGPCGVLVADREHAEALERLRRGLGAIGSEQLTLPRVSRAEYLGYLSRSTDCAEAVAAAMNAAQDDAEDAVITPVFPSLPDHPDRIATVRYPHLGGVIAFAFRDAALNRRAPLEAFVDLVLASARTQGLPLTAGTSFGFRTPRLSAAWSCFEQDSAFLRLSAGIDVQTAAAVGALIAGCAAGFRIS